MTSTFQTPAILTSAGSTADGGMRLTFHTNELPVGKKVQAMEMHNSFGNLLFRENEFRADEVPKEDVEDPKKTPSKRLRAVLFLHWKQLGHPGDLEAFYWARMEEIITREKTKLD